MSRKRIPSGGAGAEDGNSAQRFLLASLAVGADERPTAHKEGAGLWDITHTQNWGASNSRAQDLSLLWTDGCWGRDRTKLLLRVVLQAATFPAHPARAGTRTVLPHG